MPQLTDFEGQMITLLLFEPRNPNGLTKRVVKLVSVDDGGIWVEDQDMTNSVLEELNLPASPILTCPFLPYSSIHMILTNIPGLSLSEKAFGA